MNFIRLPIPMLSAVLLAGCIGGFDVAHPNVLGNVQSAATWEGFGYCGGWGCSDPSGTSFTPTEWAEVVAVMTPAAPTPQAEREQVAQAVGLMERFIGPKTGYDRDLAGTGAGIFQPGQLDCYSEAANTSNFLHLLNNAGLLRHHQPADPIMRGLATSRSWRGTHATATMTETFSGVLFAMDSWFFASGHDAVFVEADTWANSWAPDGGASL